MYGACSWHLIEGCTGGRVSHRLYIMHHTLHIRGLYETCPGLHAPHVSQHCWKHHSIYSCLIYIFFLWIPTAHITSSICCRALLQGVILFSVVSSLKQVGIKNLNPHIAFSWSPISGCHTHVVDACQLWLVWWHAVTMSWLNLLFPASTGQSWHNTTEDL